MMKSLKVGKNNREDRMNFVEYWADFVRSNPDKVWSKQQRILIDSMMQNAKQFPLSAEEYLKMKGEPFGKRQRE